MKPADSELNNLIAIVCGLSFEVGAKPLISFESDTLAISGAIICHRLDRFFLPCYPSPSRPRPRILHTGVWVMRASTVHNFVYISNPKCASTSFRKALGPFSNIKSSPQRSPEGIRHHATASDIKLVFDEQGLSWESFFSFTTIRDPWAKSYSLYTYGKKTGE